MLITKEIEIELSAKNFKYYENLGYNIPKVIGSKNKPVLKQKSRILVKIEHLPVNSREFVNVKCDYCQDKTYKKQFTVYNRKNSKLIKKDACEKCTQFLREETNMLKYGVKYSSQLLERRKELRQMKRDDFLEVIKLFKDNNFTLLISEDEYVNSIVQMKCICNNHPDTIQYKKYAHLKDGFGCKFCSYDNNKGENNPKWNGGISALKSYLYVKIKQWKKNSIKNCNYKCVVTEKRFDEVHHLYGFNNIVNEALDKLGLNYKNKINEYTIDELKKIENEVLELHNKYPLGVCLSKYIHELFHKLYGYGNNIPSQFKEFKIRYRLGEFTEYIKNNKL